MIVKTGTGNSESIAMWWLGGVVSAGKGRRSQKPPMRRTDTMQLAGFDGEALVMEGLEHVGMGQIARPQLLDAGNEGVILESRVVLGRQVPAAELGLVRAFAWAVSVQSGAGTATTTTGRRRPGPSPPGHVPGREVVMLAHVLDDVFDLETLLGVQPHNHILVGLPVVDHGGAGVVMFLLRPPSTTRARPNKLHMWLLRVAAPFRPVLAGTQVATARVGWGHPLARLIDTDRDKQGPRNFSYRPAGAHAHLVPSAAFSSSFLVVVVVVVIVLRMSIAKMDILKVLSLGTNKTKRPASSTAIASTLPSAGGQTNAQLFHDHVGTPRGTKRKRRTDADAGEDAAEVSDVDFFAPKDGVQAARKKTEKSASKPAEKPKKARKTQLLAEDECKQVLRSHRLKFTLLSARPEKKPKVKKSKKKTKAVAEEAKPKNKHLFPQPLRAFEELRSFYNISSRLADNIEAQGYKEPTEVQMASMPLLLDAGVALSKTSDGQVPDGTVDFMAVAPTGSGKTISFLIPAINSIMKSRAGSDDRKQRHELEAIVLAPTRELASQICNEGRKLTVGTGIKVVAMKKGMRIQTEEGKIKADADGNDSSSDDSGSENSDSDIEDEAAAARPVTKADILVTTPMLLLNLLTKGSIAKTLPSVESLILDEADVLLDQLFRDQTVGIWLACTNPGLQTTLWSATMGSNIETIVTDQLKSHAQKRDVSPNPFIRLVVGLKDTAVPNITHKLTYTATEPGKLLALRQLLHPVSGADSGPPLRPPFLVFTQTIERASALHNELKYDIPLEAGGSSRIAVLHSSLADSVRSGIMRRFRLGEIWVLITTDVLARGVDFAGVNGVVNYDVPSTAAAYVHRAGRTGRAGREGGIAVTFYTKEDIPFVKSVANVIAMSEKQAGKTGEQADVQKWLLDALPDVKKQDKKKLKTRGVEARRSAKITSKSAYERRKEHNKREAIKGSKKRKANKEGDESEGEWGGLDGRRVG